MPRKRLAVPALAILQLAWTVTAADAPGARGTDDLQALKSFIVAEQAARAPGAAWVRTMISRLGPDGTWPDIPYDQKVRAGWKPAEHVGRILRMARAYRQPNGELAGDENLAGAIGRALDWWLANDPQSPNWWHNQIGVPRDLGRALILLEDELTDKQKARGLKILSRAEIRMTGQNLVWLATNVIYRAVLGGEVKTVDQAFDRIWQEIRDDQPEGIQADASFFQHGRQLYTGGYGMAFADDIPRLLRMTRGTRFAPPAPKIRLVETFLLDGMQWMLRGPSIDPNTHGRGITRRMGDNRRTPRLACEHMIRLSTPRKAELQAWAKRMEQDEPGAEPALEGNRHFWVADLMVHHRPGWYASVQLVSNRTTGNESGNGEGLKNWFFLFGPSFLMRRGDEYRNIAPVWDWTLLPGTTSPQRTDDVPEITWGRGARGEKSFAGGVSDGQVGLAAMDFARDEIRFRKAWLLLDQAQIVLIAGVHGGKLPLRTSLNQCWLRGSVIVNSRHGSKTLQAAEPQASGKLKWVHHDRIGYVLSGGDTVQLTAGIQSGTWQEINRAGPDRQVRKGVFKLWVDHGRTARDAALQYTILPGIDADQMPQAVRRLAREVRILSNTPEIQAAERTGQGTWTLGVAFYRAGQVSSDEMDLGVDQPCLLLVRRKGRRLALTACNPENKPLALTVTIQAKLAGPGVKAEAGSSVVRFDLPDGAQAGKSVTRVFEIRGAQ